MKSIKDDKHHNCLIDVTVQHEKKVLRQKKGDRSR
jgi:hypothetical protein